MSKKPRRVAKLVRASQPALEDDGTLVSSGQVAHMLGLGRGMVLKLVSEGKIPRPKLKTPGGKGRWSRFEIMQVRRAWEMDADVELSEIADSEL